ncbi:Vacuolar protein sorting-associated protein 51 [Irineochytrium annulatum]|nr:Vacuolar protein sorting-associated protein 51 [Irineochytrium annulatum]
MAPPPISPATPISPHVSNISRSPATSAATSASRSSPAHGGPYIPSPHHSTGDIGPGVGRSSAGAGGGGSNSTTNFHNRDGDAASVHSTSTGALNSPPRQRKRIQLKDFYGIADDAPAPEPQDEQPSIKPWGADPMDLGGCAAFGESPIAFVENAGGLMPDFWSDSEAFISATFINKLMYEKPLTDLIRTDTELISEIKELDGQMKTLVYQNYNKFIAATDTIRSMRDRVEAMDSDMAQLQEKFKAISTGSEAINAALAPKRARIHQLSGVHNLLQKLNFVFELPTQLETCLKEGKYKNAVRSYMNSSALLVHYSHIPAFRKIKEECDDTMVRVGVKVREKMKNPKSTPSEITESLSLLIGLKQQFPTELAAEYLKTMEGHMETIKADAFKHMASMKPEASHVASSAGASSPRDAEKEPPLEVTKISYLNKTYLSAFTEFIGAFCDCFLSADEDTPAQRRDTKPDDKLVITAKLTAEQRDEAQRSLMRGVDKVLRDYNAIVKDMLAVKEKDIWSWSPSLPLLILDAVSRDLGSTPSTISILQTDVRVETLIVDFYEEIVKKIFATIRENFFASDVEADDRKQFIYKTINTLKSTLFEKAFPLLNTLVPSDLSFSSCKGTKVEDVLDLMVKGFEEFWLDLGKMLTVRYFLNHDVTQGFIDVSYSTFIDAVLHHHPTHAEHKQHIMQTKKNAATTSDAARRNLLIVTASGGSVPTSHLKSKGYGGGQEAWTGSGTVGTSSDFGHHWKGSEVAQAGRQVIARWRLIVQDLSARYLSIVAEIITNPVIRYISLENWHAADSPSRTNPIFDDVLDKFSNAELEIISIFDEETPDRTSKDLNMKRRNSFLSSRPASIYNPMGPGTPPLPPMSLAQPTVSSPTTSSMGGNSASTSPQRTNGTSSSAASTLHAAVPRSSSMRGFANSSGSAGPPNAGATPLGNMLGTGMFALKKSLTLGAERSGSNPSSVGGQSNAHSRANSLAVGSTLGIGGGGALAPPGYPQQQHSGGPGKFDSLLDGIGKLFQDRIEFFGKVEMGRTPFIRAVAKILIKAYLEEIRFRSISTTGLQKIQIDVESMRYRILGGSNSISDDDGSITGLLEDINSYCFRRSRNVEIDMKVPLNVFKDDGDDEAERFVVE